MQGAQPLCKRCSLLLHNRWPRTMPRTTGITRFCACAMCRNVASIHTHGSSRYDCWCKSSMALRYLGHVRAMWPQSTRMAARDTTAGVRAVWLLAASRTRSVSSTNCTASGTFAPLRRITCSTCCCILENAPLKYGSCVTRERLGWE